MHSQHQRYQATLEESKGGGKVYCTRKYKMKAAEPADKFRPLSFLVTNLLQLSDAPWSDTNLGSTDV
jgi:hypothetical protein